jgi:Protein of unknown function (DUF998)
LTVVARVLLCPQNLSVFRPESVNTYCLLVFAFGVGVWQSSGRKRALHFVAIGLIGKEVLGLAATLFFPMHLRGIEGTLTDNMHAILTLVGVLFMLLALGFGATAFGKRFRLYSIVTILMLVVGGILTGLDAPRLATTLPTPWMGVWERINIFGYVLWVVVLAIVLLREQGVTWVEQHETQHQRTL